MTKEERRREICEIVELADKVAALSRYRIWNVNGIRVVVAAFEGWFELVDVTEDGDGLARGLSRVARDGNEVHYGIHGQTPDLH